MRNLQDVALAALRLVVATSIILAQVDRDLYEDRQVTASSSSSGEDFEQARSVLAHAPDPETRARIDSMLNGAVAATVFVLGDESGDNPSEWVHQWTRMLAQTRPMTINHWNSRVDEAYYEGNTLSTGRRAAVLLRNASIQAATTPGSVAERLDALVHQPVDFVVISFAVHQRSRVWVGEIEQLMTALRERLGAVPVALILQPGSAEVGLREASQEWAQANDVVLLDVEHSLQMAGVELLHGSPPAELLGAAGLGTTYS